MDEIMNLIKINKTSERNETFQRLNIACKSKEKSEIMKLRKLYKTREDRRKKQQEILEAKEFQEKIAKLESMKNRGSFIIENAQKSNEFFKSILQSTAEETEQWQIQEESNDVQDHVQPSTSQEIPEIPIENENSHLKEYSDKIAQVCMPTTC